jgi:hypothetical protein
MTDLQEWRVIARKLAREHSDAARKSETMKTIMKTPKSKWRQRMRTLCERVARALASTAPPAEREAAESEARKIIRAIREDARPG